MRALGFALLLVPGCGYALAPALALMPIATTAAPIPFEPQMNISVGGAKVSADGEEGGGVAELTSRLAGGKGVGIASYTHLELGTFGTDRRTGAIESSLGVSVGGPGFHAALMTGLGYGGYPQNGKTLPLRLMALFDMEAVAVSATGYMGFRFDVADERPVAVDKVGPFNTWGAQLDVTAMRGIGPSVGIGFDRQDDITTLGLHVGIGLHAPTL